MNELHSENLKYKYLFINNRVENLFQTRHQDWQAGGLTTNHFLGKLREANWQLEQYESSAAPAGWACSWDRYFIFKLHLSHP